MVGLLLLVPMSKVAGCLAVVEGDSHLSAHKSRRSILITGVPGTYPAEVIIIGSGLIITNAAKIDVGMALVVMIFDRSLPRLRYLDEI